MEDLAIFIPAQINNQYHISGDLAPFGDTTLLEWKISQCKGFLSSKHIYISSSSDEINDIALDNEVRIIERSSDQTIEQSLKHACERIEKTNILWTNVTNPFMGSKDYFEMYEKFVSLKNCDLLMSVTVNKKYAFFDNKKINFNKKITSRKDIKPIITCTNGLFLFDSKSYLKRENFLDTENYYLYELDSFASIEIKDIFDYSISNDLITLYFRKLSIEA